jgi:DNA-binding PadR family transcriptional regulator
MPIQNDEILSFIPLREPTFLILLSLANGAKHGYAILKDVNEISQGSVTLSTGTLYEALARLLDQALIERVPDTGETDSQNSHPGRPRKAYRLTTKGERVMAAEMARLQTLMAVAQQRLVTEIK